MRLLEFILEWWRKRLRSIDLQVFWPQCKKHAPDIESDRLVFVAHMTMDPIYSSLNEEQLIEFVRENLV